MLFMQIEFVCHASVVLRRDPIHLICDPWLLGTVEDGWALLPEPKFKAQDFASITHIWFSHQHPDHFNPRTLAMIPEAVRKGIAVMFHHSLDGEMAGHCRKLGFGEVVELQEGQWQPLAPGFALLCDVWQSGYGSWLLLRTPEGTILNLNDCQVNQAADIHALRERIGAVDVLLAQFSVCSWGADAKGLVHRETDAQAMLQRAVLQAQGLGAKHVIPFAGYFYCHEENFHMNSAMVGVAEVAARLRAEAAVQPVVLYPGDRWRVGSRMDPEPAIARYVADLAGRAARPRIQATRREFAELAEASARFTGQRVQHRSPLRPRASALRITMRQQLRRHGHSPWLGPAKAVLDVCLLRTRPARIWLTDHESAVGFCLRNGLAPGAWARHDCDIELSSDALLYSFKFLCGGESVSVEPAPLTPEVYAP